MSIERAMNIVIALVCAGVPIFGLILLTVIAWKNYLFMDAWCEKCNSWQRMSKRYGEIPGAECPNCHWINQQKEGSCPKCWWYGKYENTAISKRGPFKKFERTDVNLFYGVQEEYWVYEVTIKCPKHGNYTAYVSAELGEQIHIPNVASRDTNSSQPSKVMPKTKNGMSPESLEAIKAAYLKAGFLNLNGRYQEAEKLKMDAIDRMIDHESARASKEEDSQN